MLGYILMFGDLCIAFVAIYTAFIILKKHLKLKKGGKINEKI